MHALQKFLLFHVLTCLGPNAFGSEIINGESASPKSLLFMASLQDSNGEHQCGGSLISDNFVLTAAHCAGEDNDLVRRVVLGTHNVSTPRVVRRIVQMCKHPDYNDHIIQNDIMLLKLRRKVPMDKPVQLIQLPPPDMKLEDGQMCQVAGWGLTETGRYPDELRVVNASVVNQNVCWYQWAHLGNPLPAHVLCAGAFGLVKGNCNGDSGGPLVCNGMVAGVVSFGDRYCNDPRLPDVYTDVSKFRPWIDEVLSKNGC